MNLFLEKETMSSNFESVRNHNKSASIKSREDRKGNIRTETVRRDEGSVIVNVSTNPSVDSTRLFVDTPDDSFAFDGRTARTIYRVLKKHYQNTEKSF